VSRPSVAPSPENPALSDVFTVQRSHSARRFCAGVQLIGQTTGVSSRAVPRETLLHCPANPATLLLLPASFGLALSLQFFLRYTLLGLFHNSSRHCIKPE